MVEKKVTICLPTYRNGRTIVQTLRSLQDQSYENLEIIIRDDHSEDDTVSKIRDSIANDPRCKLFVNEKNLGIVHNWNRCLRDAHGDYICIFHGDDIYDKDIIAKEVHVLNNAQNVGIVFAAGTFVNEKDVVIQPWELPPTMARNDTYALADLLPTFLVTGNFLICPTAMTRREVYNQFGMYNDCYTLGQDLDMWLRILAGSWETAIIEEPLIKYRVSEAQATSKYHRQRIQISEQFIILDKFLWDNRHKLRIPPGIKRQYANRKARDLFKCAIQAVRTNEIRTAKHLIKESLIYQKRPKLLMASWAILMGLNLKLASLVRHLLKS
ncbi:glycosyltransferase [candidate division KSB1 bacterium]|nr:glycosyltransferase [candidate division KSB1 bacterium]NIR71145.1 glycosyltransferase [candidate division KSB1 bacterium]NIS23275.1 glycosyltransferase [candidate division KSB1 bacterium]NIT70153.1 glycosyltransferase [candidate division KSB1 bacterium]NIU23805.1 glycosyltransferase [candidate division KSB1 bacterium]